MIETNRNIVLATWAFRAIKDYFMAFYLDDRFPWYSTFFYHQGLEKLCKAYLLGTRSSEFEQLPREEAKVKVNELAKDRDTMGHGLKGMITRLMSLGVLPNDVLKKKYGEYSGKPITGEDTVQILERAYIECRYPVPDEIHKDYPFKSEGGATIGYHEPLGSSEPKEFSRDVGLAILVKIEEEFGIEIPREKFTTAIEHEEWQRFKRVFFRTVEVIASSKPVS